MQYMVCAHREGEVTKGALVVGDSVKVDLSEILVKGFGSAVVPGFRTDLLGEAQSTADPGCVAAGMCEK